MLGQEILVSSPQHGLRKEGILDDTSKPGTCLEIVPATAFVGGRPHYRARSAAAGAKGPIVVLLPDHLEGKLATDAYVSGTRCFVYYPAEGEELNMLLGDVGGTGDIVTQGDKFGVNNNGKLIADSAYTSAPFQAMETLPALTADTLVWCVFNGSYT